MKPIRFVLAFLLIMLASLLLMGAVPAAVYGQIDPTDAHQTNAAAVQQLFDQTATAVPLRTAEAILSQTAAAQTATAAAQEMAPTQTLQALFDAALTATAMMDTPDYSQYRVIDVQEFDLRVGPGRTGAHLTLDGEQFAHLSSDEICLYRRSEGQYAQDRCLAVERSMVRGLGEDVFWSPDGRYLSLGTFDEALLLLRDTDIRVIDTETGALITLTEDNFDGGLVGEITGSLDLASRWLNADTLVFVRYDSRASADGETTSLAGLSPPALYTVTVPSDGVPSKPELRFTIPSESTLSIYILAVDGPRGRIAFVYDTRDREPLQGVWTGNLDGTDLMLLHPVSNLRELPMQLSYSADGRHLLTFAGETRSGALTMRVISTETGAETDIDPRFPTRNPDGSPLNNDAPVVLAAGWSPRGSALAYIVRDTLNPQASGLYLTAAPGVPGTLVLPGNFYGTTCCQRAPIRWARNDVIMIGRGPAPGLLLVQVGQ
jgi:hypothetical protein